MDFLQTLLFEDKKPVLKRQTPLLVLQYFGSPCPAKKQHPQNFGSQAQLGRSSPNNSPPTLCKKLQNFGSQALLVRTCYGPKKRTAEYWEPSPACQILPILFSSYVSTPPPKNTATFWEPSPAWQSTTNKIFGEKKTLTKRERERKKQGNEEREREKKRKRTIWKIGREEKEIKHFSVS